MGKICLEKLFLFGVVFFVEFILGAFGDFALNVAEYPVDEQDDDAGDDGFTPHAEAAEASHCRWTPESCGGVESVDGESVFHDDAGTQETYARDDLWEYAQVVEIGSVGGGGEDDALGGENEYAGTYSYQGVGNQSRIALAQLTLQSDEDSCHEGAE